MSDKIHAMSLTALADALASGELSAVQVMEAAVVRAERLQPLLNCFISLEAEPALEAAAAADAALARGDAPGPLHGVPNCAQGHVLPCRADLGLRLPDPPGLRTGP